MVGVAQRVNTLPEASPKSISAFVEKSGLPSGIVRRRLTPAVRFAVVLKQRTIVRTNACCFVTLVVAQTA